MSVMMTRISLRDDDDPNIVARFQHRNRLIGVRGRDHVIARFFKHVTQVFTNEELIFDRENNCHIRSTARQIFRSTRIALTE
jgi:succinate dehydrogenase flavin-adding protein (antitoxin of CptAB toxin-antitoxin module)